MRYKALFVILLVIAAVTFACNLSSSPEPAPTVPPATPYPTYTPYPTPTIVVEKELSAVLDTADTGSVCPQDSTPVDNGDTPSFVGEKDDRYGCEGFWTFDIQVIPSTSKILSAIFSPGSCMENGKPFSYGDLAFEFVSIHQLAMGDYGAGGVGYTVFKNCSLPSIDMTLYVQSEVDKGAAIIQIRAYMTAGNFGNGVADYVSFRTGNIPTLIIRYK
jgi:hypothetical protein